MLSNDNSEEISWACNLLDETLVENMDTNIYNYYPSAGKKSIPAGTGVNSTRTIIIEKP